MAYLGIAQWARKPERVEKTLVVTLCLFFAWVCTQQELKVSREDAAHISVFAQHLTCKRFTVPS